MRRTHPPQAKNGFRSTFTEVSPDRFPLRYQDIVLPVLLPMRRILTLLDLV